MAVRKTETFSVLFVTCRDLETDNRAAGRQRTQATCNKVLATCNTCLPSFLKVVWGKKLGKYEKACLNN